MKRCNDTDICSFQERISRKSKKTEGNKRDGSSTTERLGKFRLPTKIAASRSETTTDIQVQGGGRGSNRPPGAQAEDRGKTSLKENYRTVY